MIQELLGGGSSGVLNLGGERKISPAINNCGGISRVLEGSSISSPSIPPTGTNTNTTTCTSAVTTTTFTNSTTPPTSDQQNLRCPRCDSSNTKFCYYNNYNLTQPRYFCKTCRRYWTKGGALRNVPIGGGCRKNKSPIVTTTAGKAISVGKIKSVSQDNVKPSLVFGFQDHDSPSNNNPFLWPSQSQTSSQLLALLRGSTQNPNPNCIKEEGNMIGSQMISDHSVVTTGPLNSRSLSLDHTSTTHVPFSLSSSFWRNNENRTPQQQQQQEHQQQQQSFLVGEVQNTGIQELYQRLRSSANYYSDHSSQVLNSAATSQPTNSSSIIEPASTLTGSGELGSYWNPSFAWSNLSTTNGAFP